MRVLVTGACGFTGSYVVPELILQRHNVSCFVRQSTDRRVLKNENVQWHVGDLADVDTLSKALNGMDALVNIASIGFGHAPKIVEAAQKANIKRAVFISTTAIFTTLNAPSKKVRLEAEETIRNSHLDYTILRPTMIYGSSRDRNMIRLIKYLEKWPVMVVIGNGKCLQQPVYVKDLATAVANVLDSPCTARKCYNVPGKKPVSFDYVIRTIAALLEKNIKIFHVPYAPIVRIMQFVEHFGITGPIKSEQILRLNEDKAFDPKSAISDFGYSPVAFEEGIRLEIENMRKTFDNQTLCVGG